MSSVSPTDYCIDYSKGDDYSGYSLLSIQVKNEEESLRIFHYICAIEDEVYGAFREINKVFDVMVSPKTMEEMKEYLNKNGFNYRITIEDMQKYFEENRAKEKEMNEKIDE